MSRKIEEVESSKSPVILLTQNWTYEKGAGHSFKSDTAWANHMASRGWTPEQINEAITSGVSFLTPNRINAGNTATKYIHPTTGRSVGIDDVTRKVLHVGKTGFKYYRYNTNIHSTARRRYRCMAANTSSVGISTGINCTLSSEEFSRRFGPSCSREGMTIKPDSGRSFFDALKKE